MLPVQSPHHCWGNQKSFSLQFSSPVISPLSPSPSHLSLPIWFCNWSWFYFLLLTQFTLKCFFLNDLFLPFVTPFNTSHVSVLTPVCVPSSITHTRARAHKHTRTHAHTRMRHLYHLYHSWWSRGMKKAMLESCCRHGNLVITTSSVPPGRNRHSPLKFPIFLPLPPLDVAFFLFSSASPHYCHSYMLSKHSHLSPSSLPFSCYTLFAPFPFSIFF